MAIYGGFFGGKFVGNSKNSQMGGVKRLNSVGRKKPNSTETNQEEKSMKKLVHFMLVTMLVIVGVFTPSVTSANAQTSNTFNKVALQADTGSRGFSFSEVKKKRIVIFS